MKTLDEKNTNDQHDQSEQPDEQGEPRNKSGALLRASGAILRSSGIIAKAVQRNVAAELRRSSIALVAGVLGSLTAIIIMGILRLTVGTPTLPELLGDRVLPLMSADTFVAFLLRFSPHSKITPLGLTLLGQFIVGILVGPLYHIAAGRNSPKRGIFPGKREWLAALAFVIGMEGLALALFWPVLAQGVVGDSLGRAGLLTSLSMLATFAGFILVTMFANHWLHLAWGRSEAAPTTSLTESPQPTTSAASRNGTLNRRTVLQAAGGVVVAVAVGGTAIERLLSTYLARQTSYDGHETYGLPMPITSNDDFYVVTQNVLDPQVLLDQWELQIVGLVNQPKAWTYDQLRALPNETRAVTFECISNGVGGHLLSNALWTGVTLQTLLNKAGGVTSQVQYVNLYSVDGYSTGLPLSDLLEARTMFAWGMNGEQLPQRHGFPLRAVTPGRYGEQSPKWLTRIEFSNEQHKGLYESQGWNSGQLSTLSRIDSPGGQVPLAPVRVAGVAFGGIRGIQRVEVSANGGATWNTATLTPPLSDQSWVLWNWQWTPPARGDYTLIVRATNGTGALQIGTERGTVPNGSTGWHHVMVHVV